MKRKHYSLGRHAKRGSLYIFLSLFAVIILFPIYWLLTTSFKPPTELFSPAMLGFYKPTFENYHFVLFQDRFPIFLLNSTIISSCTVLVTIPVGCMAGYAFARLKMKRKDNWFFMILTTRMAPAVTFAVPIYLMMVSLGLIDNMISLISVYTFSNLALCIWLTRGFFEEVPREIEEAAMVDGVSHFGSFFRFAIPLASGGIVATAILIFIFTWNEFFYASILTQSKAKTFTVHLPSYFNPRRMMWGELAAASVLGSTVPIVFALITKKYIIRGLTMGAVKE